MLHTNYQGSRHSGFRQEGVFMFLPILAYVKHVTPWDRPFLARVYNLNKLGRGPLGNTTYQISRL